MSANKKYWRQHYYLVFVLPAISFFLIVEIIPFVQAVLYSFKDWNGIRSNVKWIGFENYKFLFTDMRFLNSFSYTIKFCLLSVILVNTLGLLLALTLNQAIKSRNVLRSILFMPQIFGSIIIAFIWKFIFLRVFEQIGEYTEWSLFQTNWLSSPGYAFLAIVTTFVWQNVGYLMVIYVAALQGVSKDVMESAELDGANYVQKLNYIVIPLIRPATTICLFLAISMSMNVFDINFALTNGGPFKSTESIALHIYNEAFVIGNFSLGTAKSVVFLMLVGAITLIQVAIMKRKEVSM